MHMSCPHLGLIPDSRAVVERGVSEHYMTYAFNSDRQMSTRASVLGYVHWARRRYLAVHTHRVMNLAIHLVFVCVYHRGKVRDR